MDIQFDLKINKTVDGKFKISLNDFQSFVVEKIYFVGKFGNDAVDYIQAIESYIPDCGSKLNVVSMNFIRNKDVIDSDLIIYVDTPFTYRFDRLLSAGYKPEYINDVVEKEKEEFDGVEEILKKHKFLIIQ